MSVERTGLRPQNTRFEFETTDNLKGRINDMEGAIIDSAWQERVGGKAPNVKLNRALMTAKAVFAERQGNYEEGRRLRGTLRGVERKLGVVNPDGSVGTSPRQFGQGESLNLIK